MGQLIRPGTGRHWDGNLGLRARESLVSRLDLRDGLDIGVTIQRPLGTVVSIAGQYWPSAPNVSVRFTTGNDAGSATIAANGNLTGTITVGGSEPIGSDPIIVTAGATTVTIPFSVNAAVTFSPNGGSGSMVPELANTPTVLSTNAFTRAGFTFTGWNTASDGSGAAYADGATYAFTADTTLYVQWVANTHTVTFDGNGGSGSMVPELANTSTVLSTNAFTRAGFTFTGWNTASDGSGVAYADGATYAFTADTTLYVQWVANTHTVTFDGNGGSGSMVPELANTSTVLSTNAFTVRASRSRAGTLRATVVARRMRMAQPMRLLPTRRCMPSGWLIPTP